MTIREETKADFPEIAALTRAAFGGEYEVVLIEKLRAAHLVTVSFSPYGTQMFSGDRSTHAPNAYANMPIRPNADTQHRPIFGKHSSHLRDENQG